MCDKERVIRAVMQEGGKEGWRGEEEMKRRGNAKQLEKLTQASTEMKGMCKQVGNEDLVIESYVHEVAMHVCSQEIGSYQMR